MDVDAGRIRHALLDRWNEESFQSIRIVILRKEKAHDAEHVFQ